MKKSVAVIGIGRFGLSVAKELYKNGCDVMVFDHNSSLINEIAENVTCAMTIDARDPKALEEAGIGDMDVVVTGMSDHLEPTIMSIVTAKSLGVPQVIAKAKDALMGNIIEKVGADTVIYPEQESGVRMCQKIIAENFIDYFDISDTSSLVEMYPKEEWVGKSLRELELRKKYKVNVVAVMQGDDFNITMDPDTPLKKDEKLLITIKKKDLSKFESKN
ncbi:MAG: potassium channel family protein [Lachnospiraceae bacterium]